MCIRDRVRRVPGCKHLVLAKADRTDLTAPAGAHNMAALLAAASPVTVRSPLLLTVAVTLPSRLRDADPVTVERIRTELVVRLSIADCAVPAAVLME